MTITHIDVVSLPVSDQERARDFYVGTLGFELVRQNKMGPAQQWIQVAPKGAQTSITLVTWFDTMPAGSLQGLVLHADDIDAEVAALTAKGVQMPDGVQDAPWGRYAVFTDPDGNRLVLQGRPPRA
ncbi:catechol 2,3-dioxygenase-like lactoylglutathione lyase family enzyme [Actinoplanes tereljensis]|uniref:Glyoxalase n=1 Tax=Paractinoplanes tereljensis TaxID=571912 RepID=A0A919TWF8_9ACTN|nr:VOC family protein [Actinoplanes tereljensis]GIF23240.1 glyoxalase [Actinoplanes tereljensis]